MNMASEVYEMNLEDENTKLKAEIDKKQYTINHALELVRQMDSTKFDSITADQYEKLQCLLEMSTA